MPRLRQRMACRKGASRGRSLGERPPLSHHVDRPLEPSARRPAFSSSGPPGPRPDFLDMAPPRSDPPPLVPPSFPPQPLVTASSPTPSGGFLRQATQHTELRFDRAFDHPFSVFLTVTLSEELPFPPASHPSLLQPPSAPAFAPPSVPNPAPFTPSSCAPSVPFPPSSGHFNLQVDAGLTEDEENKAADGDQDDQYGCRIMEEHSGSD